MVPRIQSDTAATIVIGDRYPDEPMPIAPSQRVATVTVGSPLTPNVRIVHRPLCSIGTLGVSDS